MLGSVLYVILAWLLKDVTPRQIAHKGWLNGWHVLITELKQSTTFAMLR